MKNNIAGSVYTIMKSTSVHLGWTFNDVELADVSEMKQIKNLRLHENEKRCSCRTVSGWASSVISSCLRVLEEVSGPPVAVILALHSQALVDGWVGAALCYPFAMEM